MTQNLRTIRLYGVLGATFGRVHKLAVETPAEAIRAMSIVIPGFEKFMNTAKKRGLTFAIFSGKRNLDVNGMGIDRGGEDIRIAPVLIGSKSGGIFQTILGVVLVAVGVVYGYFSEDWSTAAYIIETGVSMTVGGVIQLLSPQASGLLSKQDADNKASYAFGSPTNTVSQGYPVPLLYGRRRIGGAIISAGIYVEDQQ